jgi:hypothetical protein
MAFVGTAIVSVVIGAVIGPAVSDYFEVGSADLRYTLDQPRDRFQVEQVLIHPDGDSVSMFLGTIRMRVRNGAFKTGWIDRAEFVPRRIDVRPKIELLGVDRRPIRWHETAIIEVRALFTVPLAILGPPTERQRLDFEVKLFDNTGREVARFVDGRVGEMLFWTTGDFKREVVGADTPRPEERDR